MIPENGKNKYSNLSAWRKRTGSLRRKASCGVFVACGLLFGLSCSWFEYEGRDFVLAIDTSGSMNEEAAEGKMIIRVKKAMERLVDLVQEKDRVFLLSFDDGVQRRLDLDVGDQGLQAGKTMILQFVESLVAEGRYTDMKAMVLAIRKYLQRRQDEGNVRETFVVILSDGLDDPNPQKEREAIALETLTAGENLPEDGFKETFIYYLSVGRLLDAELVRDLEKLSDEQQVTTIEESEPEVGINQVIRELSYEKKMNTVMLTLNTYKMEIGGGIALALLLILFRRYQTRFKLEGTLEYYDRMHGSYSAKKYRLYNIQRHKVKIGANKSVDLRIRKLGVGDNVVLNARKIVRQTGARTAPPETVLRITSGGDHVKFVQQSVKGVIGYNDVFSIGRYNFVYGKRKKSKTI